MEFDLQAWLLIGLPLAFVLGWLASRLDVRQMRREHVDSPKAYYKGLNLLLNEQQDKAIDAFIEAVQNDPDTTELHFALGNLFRRRGEFERSVRVHQHLLARADLPASERDRAQHALAQDFMKAGLFDRAEAAYRALVGGEHDREARLALLNLYERSRDWRNAAEMARALEVSGAGAFGQRISHHWCEVALEADARQQSAEATEALALAHQAAPQAPRPQLIAGQRALAAGQAGEALTHWEALLQADLASFSLVAMAYAQAGQSCGQVERARATLTSAHEAHPSLDVIKALAVLDGSALAQSPLVLPYLKQQATLAAAQAVLNRPAEQWTQECADAVGKALDKAGRPLQRYRCAACGFEAQRYFWQCPGCLSWDSFPPQRIEDQ
ncbi:lipopolysaccharide assembly protein LapB [Ideonella paludis]|uniref:Lipopolysaccharide assembly protein B n=1 Tax=Ideonella paludis TaxID=1233411 RepID=A0ABS5DVN0_9BURK|nr:lipopolysaccharide assembly protein LapB [Ideonella paludis]MBQ0935175.1 lipopolysaccharide assembly protein LapB [Ideonella paludis]